MTFRSVVSLSLPLVAAALAVPARGQLPLFEGPEVPLSPATMGFSVFTLGDVDGDGDARDIVAVYSSSEDIVAYRSTGNGTWSAPIVTPASQLAAAADIELADLDGDGDLDLVVANANVFTNTVTVLRNTGTGSFTSHVSYPVGAGAVNLVLADLDLDGDVDIAASIQPNGGSSIAQFKVLRNQGNGTFAAAMSSAVGVVPWSMVGIDADLDGDMDLALTEYSTNSVRVHLNAGDGSFPSSTAYPAGVAVEGLCALDVDGDGDLDLAASASTGISVLTRASDGTFPTFTVYPGATSRGITPFDADGDGRMDLVVRAPNDRFAVVEVSGGVLQPAVEYAGYTIRGFGPADFDGDGDVDLLLAGSQVHITRNSGDGRFYSAQTETVGGRPRSVRLGDLDGDGDLDAVNVSRDDGTAKVLWNSGDGSWGSSLTIPLGAVPVVLRLADVDSDLDLDLVVAGSGSGLMVVRNLGGGSFGPVSAVPVSTTVNDMQLADMDADGDLDAIVVMWETTSTPTVWRLDNDGNGNFSAPSTIGTQTLLRGVSVADLDGDGLQDLVFARDQAAGSVTVQLGMSGGTYAAPVVYPLAENAWSVQTIDIDGDGDRDVCVRGAVTWRVLVNDGTGVLTSGSVLPDMDLGSGLDVGFVLTDVDGDGHRDLVVGVETSLATARGHGDGTFDPPRFVGLTITQRASFAVGDVDSDGDLDFVSTSNPDVLALVRGCQDSGSAVCAGDGSAAACPCGNASAPGSATGCANSFGLGGALRASGPALITDDRLRLDATQLPPTASALYFQGTTEVGGGLGTAFGDGLRCVTGSVVRLGTKVSASGSSSYPVPGDLGVVARGGITTPGVRLYQVWYRNAALFCTASTFNLTNALRVTWIL